MAKAHIGEPSETHTHFVAAGDLADIAMIARLMRRLPAGAYGQVFLETDGTSASAILDGPGRIGVTWLVGTSSDSGARGARAARAVAAWMSEWMPDDLAHDHDSYPRLIGCFTPAVTRHLRQRLGDRAGLMHPLHGYHG
ncbi:SIP domain-containing protein [Microbacterium atlanticum]|uniref:SIP domain-containing protein n=1 Tax=Microbacterium atlanticum TaxID=2782168 RepID=UPI001888DAAB|nr:SIP domain-containing protein [Microbacterium atlanticum]